MDQSNLNRFLNEEDPPVSGSLTVIGNKLTPLEFPESETLVKKIELAPNVPNMTIIVKPQGIPISSVPGILPLSDVGFELTTPTGADILGEINPAQMLTQTSGPKIPTNWEEARKSLQYISTTRSGTKSRTFNFTDLKLIARNLNLESTGVREKKEALANRLREAIKAYHGIKE